MYTHFRYYTYAMEANRMMEACNLRVKLGQQTGNVSNTCDLVYYTHMISMYLYVCSMLVSSVVYKFSAKQPQTIHTLSALMALDRVMLTLTIFTIYHIHTFVSRVPKFAHTPYAWSETLPLYT